jgi:hypothetical protein
MSAIALEDIFVFVFLVVVPSTAVYGTTLAVFYWLLAVWIPFFAFDAWTVWVEEVEQVDDDEEEEEEPPKLQLPCWRVSRSGASKVREMNLLAGFVCGVLAFILRWRVAFWRSEIQGVSGASSGSWEVDNPDVAYNADGFYSDASYPLFQPTVCVYSSASAKWGNDNGGPAAICYPPIPGTGYPDLSAPACPVTETSCLATNRSQDYPNPAKCLAGGMFMGENTTTCASAEWCPGTVLNPDGIYVGRSTCSYCLAYERAQNGWADPATAYCPSVVTGAEVDPATNWWTCGVICPGAATRLTLPGAQSATTSFDGTALWAVVRWARDLARTSRKWNVVA